MERILYLFLMILLVGFGLLFFKRVLGADAVVTWQTGTQPPGVLVTSALVQWNQCGSSWAAVQQQPGNQALVSGLPVGTNCFRVQNVSSDGAISTPSATVSAVLVDSDGDGISDVRDNCSLKANASQCDGDGDGYGNLCDGDLNNNGATNGADSTLLQNALGTANPSADLNCNGYVNAQDTTLFRALLGYPPGPSGLH